MIPVVISTNGYGMPVKSVDSGAPEMVVASNGYGTPIVLSELGAPFIVRDGNSGFSSSHPILLTRATEAWAQDLSGNLFAFGVDQRRLTNAGLTITGAATRLHGEAPANGGNTGSIATLPAEGLFNPSRSISLGSDFHRKETPGFALTAGVPLYGRVRLRSGTSGRVNITCRNYSAGASSIISGTFAAPSVTDTSAGAITAIVNRILPNGDREFTFTWTPNAASGGSGAIGAGPNSGTSGEYIDIIGIQATSQFSEWIMGGAGTVAQAADVGVLQLATGTYNITVTFDDHSTQLFSGVSVTAPGWAIPTNMNRLVLKRIAAAAAALTLPEFQSVTQTGNVVIGGFTYQYNTALKSWSVQTDPVGFPDLRRFEVRSGDIRSGDPSDRERSEMSGSQSSMANGTEQWLAYPMIVDSYGTEQWLTLYQAFGVASGSNTIVGPILKLEVRDGTITEINVAGNNTNAARLQRAIWQGTPLEKGKLYNFVWRMVFDGAVGELDLWVNGAQILSLRNLDMGFGADGTTYHKYGIYRDTNGTVQPTCVATYGLFERAVGVNALQARIAAPIPMPYYSGVLPLGAISGALVAPPSTGRALDALTFATSPSDQGRAEIVDGVIYLLGTGASFGASVLAEIATTPGQSYTISFDLSVITANSRVGTTAGGTDLAGSAVQVAGPCSIAFTATTSTSYLRLNRQSASDTAEIRNLMITP